MEKIELVLHKTKDKYLQYAFILHILEVIFLCISSKR